MRGLSGVLFLLLVAVRPGVVCADQALPAEIGHVLALPADCAQLKEVGSLRLLVQPQGWGRAVMLDTGLRASDCQADNLLFDFRRAARAPDVPAATTGLAWEELLGYPWRSQPGFLRDVGYSISDGTPGSAPVARGMLSLRLLDPGRLWLACIMVGVTWLAMLWLARASSLVRDASPLKRAERGSYSLARVQMAWWFALIYGAYVFLWLIHREPPDLGGQALALLGMAGGTGLMAAALDSTTRAEMPGESAGLFLDLLTDVNGVTIHRFQMLVMTVTQGVLFLCYVAQHLSMPPLDESALALMGISAGGYLGFKVPEKHVEESAVGQAKVVAEEGNATAG